MIRSLLLCVFVLIACYSLKAQQGGILSGSIESNSLIYQADKEIGSEKPKDNFATNNYLKLNYNLGNFDFGVQFEGYYPVLLGYPQELKDGKLINKYVSFSDCNFRVTVGDFYDQFGNGLIFRSWEDRSLGINNAIEGVHVAYSAKYISAKGFVGRQRKFMDYGEGKVRGADLEFSLSEILKLSLDKFTVEGSWINRYHQYLGSQDIPEKVDLYSGRVNLEHKGFQLNVEYVEKSPDPSIVNNNSKNRGSALLCNLGYARSGLGIMITGRRLEYMDIRSERTASGLVSNLNYLPALVRQHEYALANLNPHTTAVNGEIGTQCDIYYNIPRGSVIGGKYGMNLHVNYSSFYNLKRDGIDSYEFLAFGQDHLYQDINFDIVKRWGSKLKTKFLGSFQTYNTLSAGKPASIYKSNIGVLDIYYKINRRNAVRMELQYLQSDDYQKDWVYGQIEYSVAPVFSFYINDMYNHGLTKLHYYNGGLSYSRSRTRLALGYGRYRAGYSCSGGVCRYTPAYTGLNIALSSSF